MIHIMRAASRMSRRLPFYLAMEEWVARNLPPDEYFFTWAVEPTVICGRNQDVAAEVNLKYCQEHGIDVVRRKSGGGCVYADLDNLMLSYVTPSTDVTSTFARYTRMLADALARLGLDASATGRNDVLIGDKKVSGNAFYHIPGRSIVHGTLLCDIDLQSMLNAITPSRAKLESKMVKSVESRVTCISQHLPAMDAQKMSRYLVSSLTSRQIILTDEQVAQIEEMEQAYYVSGWLNGRSRPKPCAAAKHTRIEGIGNFTARLATDARGNVTDADLTGDFFVLQPIDALLASLKGRPLSDAKEAIADIDAFIPGLSLDDFIKLWPA